jgi:hypothetical protein
MRPEGGYVLLIMYFERLWSARINIEKLAKIGNRESDRITWEFVKV